MFIRRSQCSITDLVDHFFPKQAGEGFDPQDEQIGMTLSLPLEANTEISKGDFAAAEKKAKLLLENNKLREAVQIYFALIRAENAQMFKLNSDNTLPSALRAKYISRDVERQMAVVKSKTQSLNQRVISCQYQTILQNLNIGIFGKIVDLDPSRREEKILKLNLEVSSLLDRLPWDKDTVERWFALTKNGFPHQKQKMLYLAKTIPGQARTTSEFRYGNFVVGSASYQGCRNNKEKEDFLSLSEFICDFQEEKGVKCYCFGVFDGHGGKRCASFLSQNLQVGLFKELQGKSIKDETVIFNALKEVCLVLDQQWSLFTGTDLSGSTGSFVLILGNTIWSVNTGDSRTVLSINDKVDQLTEDAHANRIGYARDAEDRGAVIKGKMEKNAFIIRTNGCLMMTQAFGELSTDKVKAPGITGVGTVVRRSLDGLKGNGYLIIATDGLWDTRTSANVARFVQKCARKGKTPGQIAETLAKDSFRVHGNKDDITVAVVCLSLEATPVRELKEFDSQGVQTEKLADEMFLDNNKRSALKAYFSILKVEWSLPPSDQKTANINRILEKIQKICPAGFSFGIFETIAKMIRKDEDKIFASQLLMAALLDLLPWSDEEVSEWFEITKNGFAEQRVEKIAAQPTKPSKTLISYHKHVDDFRIGVVSYRGMGKTQGDYSTLRSFECPFLEETVRCYFAGVMGAHGGEKCAEFLIANLAVLISESLKQTSINDETEIMNVLNGISKEIDVMWYGAQDPSGSTVGFILIIKNVIWCVNVGDSKIVLCDNGAAINLSEEAYVTNEKYATEATDRGGQIIKVNEDGMDKLTLNGTLEFTKIFGNFERKEGVRTKQFGLSPVGQVVRHTFDPAKPNVYVLLGSAGFWQNRSSSQVAHTIDLSAKQGKTPHEISQELVEESYNKYGTTGDATAIIYALSKEKPSEKNTVHFEQTLSESGHSSGS